MQRVKVDRPPVSLTKAMLSQWLQDRTNVINERKHLLKLAAPFDKELVKEKLNLQKFVDNKLRPCEQTLVVLEAQLLKKEIPYKIEALNLNLQGKRLELDKVKMHLGASKHVLNPLQNQYQQISNFLKIKEELRKLDELKRQEEDERGKYNASKDLYVRFSSELLTINEQITQKEYALAAANNSRYYPSVNFSCSQSTSIQSELTGLKSRRDEYQSKVKLESTKSKEYSDHLESIKKGIAETEGRIQSYHPNDVHMATLKPQHELQQLLDNLSSQISERSQQKNQITTTQQQVVDDLEISDKSIARLNKELENVNHVLENTPPCHLDIKTLRSSVIKKKEEHQALLDEKKFLEAKIKAAVIKYEPYGNNLAKNQQQEYILESNQFAVNYWLNPQVLFNELLDSINSMIERFDNTYFPEQSLDARLCVLQIKNSLFFFKNGNFEKEQIQEKYFQLCGLLWQELEKLDGQDYDFASRIVEILKHHSLDSYEAMQVFEQAKLSHSSELKEKTKEDLFSDEGVTYTKAYSALETKLNLSPPYPSTKEILEVRTKAKQALDCIDKKRSADVLKNPGTGYTKLCTHTFKVISELVDHPENISKQDELQNITQYHHDGKPSSCRKVAGILLSLLGAIIVAASVVTQVLSAGVLLPASIVGVGVGAITCVSGIGFFKTGLQRGVSKSLDALNKSAEKCHPLYKGPIFATK